MGKKQIYDILDFNAAEVILDIFYTWYASDIDVI